MIPTQTEEQRKATYRDTGVLTSEQEREQAQAQERLRISRQGQAGFDVFGNPVETGGNVSTSLAEATAKLDPITGEPKTESPYYSHYDEAEETLARPMDTESTEEIQARKMKQAQGQIDALNKLYSTKLAEQREINVGQERRTASVSTLTGLAGSTEAGVQARKTEVLGEKQMGAIQQEQAVMIQSILSDVSKSAVEEARYQREESRQSAEDILNLRASRQKEAVDKLSILGSKGTATIEGLRESLSPEDFDYLMRNAGGETMASAILFESRDKAQIEEIKVMGNGIVQITRMPDGTFKTEGTTFEELGIDGTNVKSVQKLDNGQVMIVNEDGTWDTIGDTVEKTLSQKDIADIEYKKAQTAKLWGEMTGADVEADADVSDLDPTSKSILAQTGLSIPAYSFLTTGVKALTRMKSADRKQYMAEAENWAISNNIDTSIFQAEYEAHSEVVKTYVKRAAAVDLRGDDILLSLDMLKDITKEAKYGDLRFKNVVKIWGGKQINDPVAMQYAYNLEDLRSAISGFFAVQEGRTQTTIQDGEDAKELIADGLASGSIDGLIETIDIVRQRTSAISSKAAVNAQDKIWEMFGVEKPKEGGGEEKNIQVINGVQYQQAEDGLYYEI